MRLSVTVFSVLLVATLISAQEKTAVPTGALQDSMQQMSKPGMCYKEMRHFQGQEFNCRPDMKPGCCGPEWAGREQGRHFMGGPNFMNHGPFHTHARLHFFLKLLFVGMLTLNILFTIIVSLDMARSGSFNGLWIPVVLLAGIPGSAIYALFRIGDKIAGKNKT